MYVVNYIGVLSWWLAKKSNNKEETSNSSIQNDVLQTRIGCLEHLLLSTNTHPNLNKNSAEVDIAPAFRDINTACNVGQAKNGHGVCLKSVSRTTTMQGFILKAIAAAERNGQSQEHLVMVCAQRVCQAQLRCKVSYSQLYCREMHYISRLNIKFWQSRWSMKCRSRAPRHIVWLLRTITMQGFILPAITAITVAEKCTLFLDLT